jgi:MscS family membrane protein
MKNRSANTIRYSIVNFLQFAESSLDLLIYTFTKTVVWTEYHVVKQDVLLKIAAIIEGHGAEIAFPTRTLHVESDSDAGIVVEAVPGAGS